MTKDLKEAIREIIREGHEAYGLLILESLETYAMKPDATLQGLTEQIQEAIYEIEYFEPDPNDRLLIEGAEEIINKWKKLKK